MSAGSGSGSARLDAVIGRMSAAIDEPALLRRCPAVLRTLALNTQRRRVGFTGALGERRERMPMGVIAAAYYLRIGHVTETDVMAVAYRALPPIDETDPPPHLEEQ